MNSVSYSVESLCERFANCTLRGIIDYSGAGIFLSRVSGDSRFAETWFGEKNRTPYLQLLHF